MLVNKLKWTCYYEGCQLAKLFFFFKDPMVHPFVEIMAHM